MECKSADICKYTYYQWIFMNECKKWVMTMLTIDFNLIGCWDLLIKNNMQYILICNISHGVIYGYKNTRQSCTTFSIHKCSFLHVAVLSLVKIFMEIIICLAVWALKRVLGRVTISRVKKISNPEWNKILSF